MQYLIEMDKDNTSYEAWVYVSVDADGIADVDFATCLGWINNEVVHVTEIPLHRQEEMLEMAVEEYRQDDGADAVYDAMRDGAWR